MMDANGRQSQERQQRQMMEPPQQQGGWYASSNPYQPFKWPGYDPATSGQYYTQPTAQPFGQLDYFMLQQYAPNQPQQTEVQQHANVYVQQEQVMTSNREWNQRQWNHRGIGTRSEEEDWEAKARAWASAKAAQELAQQTLVEAHVSSHTSILHQEQCCEEQQVSQAVKQPAETSQLLSLLPPGQESAKCIFHEASMHFQQDLHTFPQEPLAVFVHDEVSLSCEQDRASSTDAQAAHAQVVPSSYSQAVSSSYDQDTAIAAPPGMEQYDQLNPKPSHSYMAPVLPPTPSQLQAQVPLIPFQEPIPPPVLEFHRQFDYQQPPPQDYQSAAQYVPSVSSMGMDALDINFGGPPNAMPVWSPLRGQGITFSPNMGAGGPASHSGPQFDHTHRSHHHNHSHPMQGHQPSHMFPRPRLGLCGPFGFGGHPSLGQGPGSVGPGYLPDSDGNLGPPDRPKKAPVPSWLRDELLKKKTTVNTISSATSSMPDDFVQMNGSDATTAAVGYLDVSEQSSSDSCGISDNDEDDEDGMTAVRTAAMNQEIKRLLTEILLMVTDDLVGELAQEVVDEEETMEGSYKRFLLMNGNELSEQERVSIAVETWERGGTLHHTSSPTAPALTDPMSVLVAPLKQSKASSEDSSNSESSEAAVVNVLGLATYASDAEGAEGCQREDSASTDPETLLEEQQRSDKAEDGSHLSVKTFMEEIRKGHHEKYRNAAPLPVEIELERKDEKAIEVGRKDWGRVRDTEYKALEEILEIKTIKNKRSDLKGKKSVNEDSSIIKVEQRSPTRVCYVDVQIGSTNTNMSVRDKVEPELSDKYVNAKQFCQLPTNLKDEKQFIRSLQPIQETALDAQPEVFKSACAVPGNTVMACNEHEKTDVQHDRQGKDCTFESADGIGDVVYTITKELVEGKDTESWDHELPRREHNHIKYCSRDAGKCPDKLCWSSEKEKVWDKEQDKDRERHKIRDFLWGVDLERSKGKSGKERGHVLDRKRSKSGKECSRRVCEDHRDTKQSRHRSSSASSRGRSRSRSPHTQCSSSDKSSSPRQRRHLQSSSRRLHDSQSPVGPRRRRLSRSRSRSPHSKYSHRRHAPCPPRETERHR